MIDIGFRISQTEQYIIIIIGGLFILAGIVFALVNILKSRKAHKLQETKNEIYDESHEAQQDMTKEVIEEKPRRRRSGKY